MKEKIGYIALDFESELKSSSSDADVKLIEQKYELPDGKTTWVLGNERFRCTEALFQPNLIGNTNPGIGKLLYDSIQKCKDDDIRTKMYGDIVLAGGSTMFTGMTARIERELKILAPSSTRIRVIAPPDRHNSAWLGGSIMSSVSSFQSAWISKEEYDETGPDVVHRKCV